MFEAIATRADLFSDQDRERSFAQVALTGEPGVTHRRSVRTDRRRFWISAQ